MAHRAKHRQAAMINRIQQGRMIKSDKDSQEYLGLKLLVKALS